jgi:hypothetical protein
VAKVNKLSLRHTNFKNITCSAKNKFSQTFLMLFMLIEKSMVKAACCLTCVLKYKEMQIQNGSEFLERDWRIRHTEASSSISETVKYKNALCLCYIF